MPKKFGFDKRKITLSAGVREGEYKRDEALNVLKGSPYDPIQMKADELYLCKKIRISESEFKTIWEKPNKKFTDYPSYYPFYKKFKGISSWILKNILNYKPMMGYDVK